MLDLKNFTVVLAALGAALCTTHAFAEESTGWNKNAEVGLIITTGNSETQNINFKLEADTDGQVWRHKASFEAYSAEEDGVQTAEKFTLSGKSDYKLQNEQFLFVTGTYDDDRFSGFDYQLSVAAGYGKRLFKGENWYIDGEIGPGIRYSEYASGANETEGLIRLAANGKWKISPTASLTENLSTEIGEENTITKSVTALSMQIAGNLSFKAAVEIKTQSDVPAGTKDTDTKTTFNLVYGF